MPEPTPDSLQPLIKRWLQSDDPDATLESLCREHPEHAAALRARCAASTSAGAAAGAAQLDPEQVGPYRILDTLGEGGMGTVYLAQQEQPVQRQVALKLIKLGMDSVEIVRRFEQERQALALMDHEGIAKVFDCGTTERGQPYFVMELVKGVPIDTYCDQGRLSLTDRLLLVKQVCAAVQHAHQKGVIHRDLKPGNVLVSSDAGRLQVKIIDFGLAKAMGKDLIEATLHTEIGRVMGTPEYMAPEQADPSNEDVDTRADVYSLGVMLYQLLVGELPFSAKDLRRAGLLEMQRVLREVEPPKPSTKLTTLGAQTSHHAEQLRVSVGALKKALKGDLDWVVVKALEKDRNRRYESANAMAEDLQRFLDHEPLVAGPPSAAYRLQKLARRYRVQLVAAALVLLASLVFGSVAFVQWRSASQLADEKAGLLESEQAARATAQQNLARFEAKSVELGAKVDEFDQLAGVVRCEQLVAQAQDLLGRAAWPEQASAMKRWLGDCDALLAMRGGIAATIESVRASSPGWRKGGFDDPARGFLHRVLVDLSGRLDQLESDQKSRIEERLAWASQVELLTRAHPRARVTWRQVREGVAASALYAGVDVPLSDEAVGARWLGLVPMGPNPATGLYEFYHLRSAWDGQGDPRAIEIPAHAEDGSVEVEDGTGIVFVLLPGGRVTLGSQVDDEQSDFYDPDHEEDERLHEVELSPFLLARHEVTQGQWSRLWIGSPEMREPSVYPPGHRNFVGGVFTAASPAHSLSWDMSSELMDAYGLSLPTEAQWEYGCRGGTSSPWAVAEDELRRYANVADAVAKKEVPGWTCASWEDGHVVCSPVGYFLPNGFGLYDMHGNVREFCRDFYVHYGHERPGDGLIVFEGATKRVNRGGSFGDAAIYVRSASRSATEPDHRHSFMGVRAMRSLSSL